VGLRPKLISAPSLIASVGMAALPASSDRYGSEIVDCAPTDILFPLRGEKRSETFAECARRTSAQLPPHPPSSRHAPVSPVLKEGVAFKQARNERRKMAPSSVPRVTASRRRE
jgi:hypothetical protein